MEAQEPSNFLSKFKALRINRIFLNSIFIFALLILILINMYAYKEVTNLLQANKMVIHTHEVISGIDQSLYFVIDLESHYRGYLLTDNTNYLKEVDEIKKNLSENLARLNKLTHDNPEQNIKTK
jgi:CHASE3 domain sensor protein